MMLSDPIQWAVAALAVLSVVGVWLNNLRVRHCFFFWMVTNAGYIAVDVWYTELWGRAAQHCLFLALALHGWWAWGRPEAAK